MTQMTQMAQMKTAGRIAYNYIIYDFAILRSQKIEMKNGIF